MKKIIAVMLMITLILLAGCSKSSDKSAGDTQSSKSQSQAVDFKLQNLNGEKVSLSNYKGKIVVMNFFATWCPPCKAELPGFMNTKDKYKGKDVVFLFIDIQESSDTVKSFVSDRGYTDMNPLLDSDGSTAAQYGIRGIPHTYIVDREGNVVFSNEGYLDDAALKSAVDSALEQK